MRVIMTPESLIVRDLAKATCNRIANRVRLALQRMTDECHLSGDDSILKTAWEELCVQLQGEEFFAWSAYEETVNAIVKGSVAELPRHELEAVWLQTDHAFDTIDPQEELAAESRPPVYEDAVIDYIIKDYVFPLASGWSNARIQAYLDRPSD